MPKFRTPDFPDIPYDLRQDNKIRRLWEIIRGWGGALSQEVELRDSDTNFGAISNGWIVSSASVSREITVSAATSIQEVAIVLATLLKDMKTNGRLG